MMQHRGPNDHLNLGRLSHFQANAEIEGLEDEQGGPMSIRLLEHDYRQKHQERRREMIESHTATIRNGLLESPGDAEERQRRARRCVRDTARKEKKLRLQDQIRLAHAVNENNEQYGAEGEGVQGGSRDGTGACGDESAMAQVAQEEERGILDEKDLIDDKAGGILEENNLVDDEKRVSRDDSGLSKDSSHVLLSQHVKATVNHMRDFENDASVQVAACKILIDLIVSGGVMGPVVEPAGGGHVGARNAGAQVAAEVTSASFGAWAHVQSVVAEAGAIELVLEALRVHHSASAALRLAGVQLLGTVAQGNPTNRARIGGAEGIKAIIHAVKFAVRPDFSDLRDRPLTAAGCVALRNIAVNHHKNLSLVVQEKGIHLLIAALRIFPDVRDVQVRATTLQSGW